MEMKQNKMTNVRWSQVTQQRLPVKPAAARKKTQHARAPHTEKRRARKRGGGDDNGARTKYRMSYFQNYDSFFGGMKLPSTIVSKLLHWTYPTINLPTSS
eukprot:scaffold2246_cov162-Amphora_coffeaeformis.AAC.35